MTIEPEIAYLGVFMLVTIMLLIKPCTNPTDGRKDERTRANLFAPPQKMKNKVRVKFNEWYKLVLKKTRAYVSNFMIVTNNLESSVSAAQVNIVI